MQRESAGLNQLDRGGAEEEGRQYFGVQFDVAAANQWPPHWMDVPQTLGHRRCRSEEMIDDDPSESVNRGNRTRMNDVAIARVPPLHVVEARFAMPQGRACVGFRAPMKCAARFRLRLPVH